MKRIIALLLALCTILCLCACKKKKQEPTDPSAATTQTQASQQATKPSEPEKVANRHPLTGEALENPWSGQLIAVMINNLKAAMPQSGISQADIFYEIEVEGDITRCLAVFSDLSDVGVVGPIRSVRTVYNSVAASYDAPIIHAGGSAKLGLAGRYGASKESVPNWEHIDYGSNGSYFYRDTERYKHGYAYEHTLFSTGEKLTEVVEKLGYNTPTSNSYGLQFEEGVNLKGDKAE